MHWRRFNSLLAKKLFILLVKTMLTFEPVQNTTPVWSPERQASVRNGHPNLYRKRSDGSGAEEVLRTQ